MSPRRALTLRSPWPPRAARRLVPAGGTRLLRQPLWLTWRRGVKMRAAPVLPAARNLPARALSFALTVSYRIAWSFPRELAARSVPVRAETRLMPQPMRWSSETRFAAAPAGGASPTPVRRSAGPGFGAEEAGRTGHHAAVALFHTARSAPFRNVSRMTSRIDVPVPPMPRVGRPRSGWPRASDPVEIWHAATRRQQGWGRYAPAIDMETATPVRAVSSRHAGEDATVAPRSIGRVAPALSQRTAPRPGSDRAEAADVAARHPVVLAWRASAAEIGEGTPGGQLWGGRRASMPPLAAGPGAGALPAAVDRAAPRMLEPAVAERLVEDVIRRVDRRMRIERERRGL
jgi:hypothetical protein